MDGSQFDALSRRLGGLRSRRSALKVIAGAVVASVAGLRDASAQACTAHYSPCSSDSECCAGAVCEYGLCMPGCRIDGAFLNAWISPPENICSQCRPELSTLSWSPVNEGMSCWSGDPNAGITTCQAGVCRSTGPVDCRPQTACHTAAINPQTGQCVQSYAAAGTPCGGQAMCYDDRYTPADTCDGNGFCIGGGSQMVECAPYTCGAYACLTACASDGDCLDGAFCDDGRCRLESDLGALCDEDRDCKSGFCTGGACCADRSCPCVADPVATTMNVSSFPAPTGLVTSCYNGPENSSPSTWPMCPVIKLCDVTFVPLRYIDNRFSIGLRAYDGNGASLGFIEVPGTRYIYSATVDMMSQTVTFFGQANFAATISWSQLNALASV